MFSWNIKKLVTVSIFPIVKYLKEITKIQNTSHTKKNLVISNKLLNNGINIIY